MVGEHLELFLSVCLPIFHLPSIEFVLLAHLSFQGVCFDLVFVVGVVTRYV